MAHVLVHYLVKFFKNFLISTFVSWASPRFLNVIRVVDGNELYVAIGSANNLFARHIPRITSLLMYNVHAISTRSACFQAIRTIRAARESPLRISSQLLLDSFMTEHFA